jgi:hypothetical protein
MDYETPHPHDLQNVGPPTSFLGHLLPQGEGKVSPTLSRGERVSAVCRRVRGHFARRETPWPVPIKRCGPVALRYLHLVPGCQKTYRGHHVYSEVAWNYSGPAGMTPRPFVIGYYWICVRYHVKNRSGIRLGAEYL